MTDPTGVERTESLGSRSIGSTLTPYPLYIDQVVETAAAAKADGSDGGAAHRPFSELQVAFFMTYS